MEFRFEIDWTEWALPLSFICRKERWAGSREVEHSLVMGFAILCFYFTLQYVWLEEV
jgi:hypothetical protein